MFTARQLHDACKSGHTLVYAIETPGKPAMRMTMRFLDATESDVLVETTVTDAEGHAAEPPDRGRATWEELDKHGEFPRERTTVTDETITTPAGTFATRLYTVAGKEGAVSRFYFAKSLPGPPVLFFTVKGGERVSTSTLQSVAESATEGASK
jgi:hypothetical protein